MEKLKEARGVFFSKIKEFYNRHKNDWKNPKFFTLMILPHDSTNIKKFNITSNWFKVFAIVSIIFWLSSLFMFFNYFSLKNKVAQLSEVEKINLKQKVEIENLNAKIQFIETQLARLQNIDLKVRELVNLDVNNIGTPSAGGVSKVNSNEMVKVLEEKASKIEEEIKLREKSLNELAEYLEDRRSLFMATPSIWPARGLITSEFGWRKDPITGVTEYHEGIDISAPAGTQVKSAGEGVVIESGNDAGYGKVVVIDHGYGIVTRYAHLSKSYVVVGQKVKKGNIIGAVGSSGKSTGPHVHYEVRIDGVPVNPIKYLFS
ncbi:MAG: peptidoglycan DD-metalloendopeptidase family protein [Proteobacteria bacterium]|nr:peptidoglycan DD-metalloendopeptidase family protein [Pseudomonadota bacterium]